MNKECETKAEYKAKYLATITITDEGWDVS
jgi:hypothetical protein